MWNYRVTVEKFPGEMVYYTVREVYYDGKGNIVGWSEKGVPIGGYSFITLKEDFKRYSEAIGRPVLDLNELQGKPKLNT